MGEHKLPKVPTRPSLVIFNMTNAVEGFRPFRSSATEEEREYMDGMRKLLDWIKELEEATDPFAAIVPFIDPSTPDDAQLSLLEWNDPGQKLEGLTAGHFRRLNPQAVFTQKGPHAPDIPEPEGSA